MFQSHYTSLHHEPIVLVKIQYTRYNTILYTTKLFTFYVFIRIVRKNEKDCEH